VKEYQVSPPLRDNLRFDLKDALEHACATRIPGPKYRQEQGGNPADHECRTDPGMPHHPQGDPTNHASFGAGDQRSGQDRFLRLLEAILLFVMSRLRGWNQREGCSLREYHP
jgi:hypothetical protein